MDNEDIDYLDPNERYLMIITFIVSTLSLCGSLFIIFTYTCIKRLRNFAFKLVVYLSISDVILTFGNMLISDQFDDATSDQVCYLQALLTNYGGLASILWTTVIAYTLYITVVKQKSAPTYHGRFLLYGFGIPLLMTAIPMLTDQFGSAGGWCWIKADPNNKAAAGAMRFLEFYLPLWGAIGFNLYSYLQVISYIKRFAGGNNLEIRFVNRLKYYPFVLVVCWTFASINRVYTLFFDEIPILNILHIAFGGLQGFLNAMVYGCTISVRQVYGGYFFCFRSCLYDSVDKQEGQNLKKPEETEQKQDGEKLEMQVMD